MRHFSCLARPLDALRQEKIPPCQLSSLNWRLGKARPIFREYLGDFSYEMVATRENTTLPAFIFELASRRSPTYFSQMIGDFSYGMRGMKKILPCWRLSLSAIECVRRVFHMG